MCRELTKTHEEVRRGALGDLVRWAEHGVRGEITVVIAGMPTRAGDVAVSEVTALVAELHSGGLSRRDAIAQAAATFGLPRRQVYEAAIAPRSATDASAPAQRGDSEDCECECSGADRDDDAASTT